ncbi:MAG: 4Fe-4S dicluster domain-containing protein [Nitrospirae bacterium]|nr:4Fe-4S dicluster domain-containing protein [Nitrospirota bacterium]
MTISRRELLLGAFGRSPTAPRVPGVARLDRERCLAWSDLDCRHCVDRCPRSGVAMILEDFKPVVVPEACDGCGDCERICVTVNIYPAIRVISKSEA